MADKPKKNKAAVIFPDVTVNGIRLGEFAVTAENETEWRFPIYTLRGFFRKYCGTEPACGADGAHKIVLGGKKPDGSDYGTFETGIYFADGNIYLGCANPVMAQKTVFTFIHQYLNVPGKDTVVLPSDGTQAFLSDAADDWDLADPDVLTVQDRIIRGCCRLEAILEYDHSRGTYFTYQNHGYKGTIAESRATDDAAGNRTTNCVILGNWVMKDAGFYSSGIYNHTYDGTFGCTFSKESADFFAEYFDVLDVRDQNVTCREMLAEGKLLPGDIIGYHDHNQMILPFGLAMDGGRGNCEGSVGSRFLRWIGPNPSLGTQVGFIIRSKDAE